jgi:hypothetical protein
MTVVLKSRTTNSETIRVGRVSRKCSQPHATEVYKPGEKGNRENFRTQRQRGEINSVPTLALSEGERKRALENLGLEADQQAVSRSNHALLMQQQLQVDW